MENQNAETQAELSQLEWILLVGRVVEETKALKTNSLPYAVRQALTIATQAHTTQSSPGSSTPETACLWGQNLLSHVCSQGSRAFTHHSCTCGDKWPFTKDTNKNCQGFVEKLQKRSKTYSSNKQTFPTSYDQDFSRNKYKFLLHWRTAYITQEYNS